MYKLMLTYEERKAIDWVGYRYGHGDDLRKLLNRSEQEQEKEWDDHCDMTFLIPEHIAWQIRDIGEECEYRWDCFADDLANKLTEFCDKII